MIFLSQSILFGVSIIAHNRVTSYVNYYHLRRTNHVPPTMGILSLCADSGRPPGRTMSSSSSPDPDNPLTKMSLHVNSAPSSQHGRTPPPVPTIFLHNQLRTQAHLWLQWTLHFKELLPLFVFLGFALSWLPLTAFLSSTFYLSISLTADDLATEIEEAKSLYLPQTTREQRQQEPTTKTPVHTSFPLHLPPGTSLHDNSALPHHQAPQHQPPPINHNWFTPQRHQYPTHGHNNDSSLLYNTTTPSWPRTLAITWLPSTQTWFPRLRVPLFLSQPQTTWRHLFSWPRKIQISWLNWLQAQRVYLNAKNCNSDNLDTPNAMTSLPLRCAPIWSILMHLWQRKTRKQARKCTIRQRWPHYPQPQPPVIHSSGTITTAWNIVYDPDSDTILTWQHNRVRIYRRRGQRQLIYLKGKHENTFPRKAQPIHRHWQGSTFIVTHIDHWTNKPTAIPEHRGITEWQANPVNCNSPTHIRPNSWQQITSLDNNTGNSTQTMATLIYQRKMTTRSTNNFAWHQPRPGTNDNPKNDSSCALNGHPLNHLWFVIAHFLQSLDGLSPTWMHTWPLRQWLVSGSLNLDDFFSSCAAVLYALWGGRHTVWQVSLVYNRCRKISVTDWIRMMHPHFGRICCWTHISRSPWMMRDQISKFI